MALRRNPNKPTWFVLGAVAGVFASASAVAIYLFRRLQKL